MSTKNKSFMQELESNPAMRFISQPQESTQGQITQRFTYAEKKSQRVQIVMQPSVISRAKAAAEGENISLNEFIHRAIIEKLDREGK